MIEDIFALAVPLHIKRARRMDCARIIFEYDVLGQPSGSAPDGTGDFESIQECVADEWVVITGAGIPGICRNVCDPINDPGGEGEFWQCGL